MSIRENILTYFKDEFLPEHGVTDVSEVTDYEDRKFSSGYCETCWYEEYNLVITYKDKKGKVKTYQHYDSLADLLRYA
jgi:hypothetical protein